MTRAPTLLCLLTPIFLSEAAHAANPAEAPATGQTDAQDTADITEDETPTLVPYRRDTVGGHFQIAATGSFALPFGRLSEDVAHSDLSGNGFGLGLDLGYGLNRQVVVGAYGETEWYGSSNECSDCSSTGLGAGLLVKYHLAQGLRLDPWLSYGIGYRALLVSASDEDLNYSGLEWLRLAIGATWFASPNFGFGPSLQFGAASMFKRPDGENAGGVNWRMLLGLRLVFDTPGK